MPGVKGKSGGRRPGGGRKPKAQEIEVRALAIGAIVGVYGSLEEGLKRLLLSQEPTLVKFVYEHAFGKPTDKVQHSGNPDSPVLFTLDGRFKDRDTNNS